MIKTIYLNEEQPVEIDTSMGWLLRYRETFGNDILPDLLPILEAITLAAIDLLDEAESAENIGIDTVLDALRGGTLINAISMLGGLETTTLLQIVWAMHKEANEGAPGFRAWTKTVPAFYFDEVAPELFWAISDSAVSKKNMDKLKSKLKKEAPEAKTEKRTNTSTSTPS